MKRLTFLLVSLVLCAAPPAVQRARSDDANKPVVCVIKTNLGTIEIELDAKKAPITVKNFLGYVDGKHYDGLVFHRVIKDFMIQGGGFKKGFGSTKTLDAVEKLKAQKDGKGIRNEAQNGLSNKRGTIAMARTGDPDSATDQFFINTVDNSEKLDPGKFSEDGYAVFGKVIKGMDIVDKIKAVKTKTLPIEIRGRPVFKDVPVEEVVIESIRREGK